MIARTKHKLNLLRQQPENIRLRAAVAFTAMIGGALTVISLAVLLPLQLYLLNSEAEPVTAQGPNPPAQVGGITNVVPPSPAVSASPAIFP